MIELYYHIKKELILNYMVKIQDIADSVKIHIKLLENMDWIFVGDVSMKNPFCLNLEKRSKLIFQKINVLLF